MEDPNEHLRAQHEEEVDLAIALPLAEQYYPTLFGRPNELPTAQDLMQCVLTGDTEKARSIYLKNPELLFTPVIATDLASGLDAHFKPIHRVINSTPLRAMAGGGDVWMLDDVWESLPNHRQEIISEIRAQFPNGFEYPMASFDFSDLLNAIDNDDHLKAHGAPNEETQDQLDEFRAHFLPNQNTTNETIGHHFNMNEYIQAGKLFDMRCKEWNSHQLSLFYTHVIGGLQGLFSVTDALVLLQNPQGVEMPGGQTTLNRNLNFGIYTDPAIKKPWVEQILFDREPKFVHGKDFAIDPNRGTGSKLGEWDIHTGRFDEMNFARLCEEKSYYLANKVTKSFSCTIL